MLCYYFLSQGSQFVNSNYAQYKTQYLGAKC